MLENGPWFNCNNPYILKKLNPDVNLQKEDVSSSVPMKAFTEDGLSIIGTKLCTPLILDSYTSDMYMQSYDRSSYARAMIELRADEELKDTIVVAMPKLIGEGFNMCTILVKKKQVEVFRQEVSNSNLFDALNSIQNDDMLGTNEGNSCSAGKRVAYSSISITPIAKRIDKFERQLIEGKLLLVDDDWNPLPKIFSTVNADSDSEVEEVFDEYATSMASSLKRGSDSGYGTNSLCE
ncbi:hypothetical protein Tco_0857102 [Tanacetum coccineum]|uniref:Uncharacterized protein n=1 Tax=Tanacetum coccineum TaxID=301880 RepID=A0ABQ5B5N7_9ASTR